MAEEETSDYTQSNLFIGTLACMRSIRAWKVPWSAYIAGQRPERIENKALGPLDFNHGQAPRLNIPGSDSFSKASYSDTALRSELDRLD